MAIEFHCSGCGKLMRTPDESAGKTGKCPACGTKVQIPATSVSSSSVNAATPPSAATQSKQSAVNPTTAPIQFACQSCGKLLSVPAANAGKKGKCPHCTAIMSIPLMSTVTAPTSTRAATPSPKWKEGPKPLAAAPVTQPTGPIQFNCPHCQCQVKISGAAAGKQGQCPRCKSVITIPTKSTVSPIPAGLQPLDASGGLTPLDSPGLSPLGNDPLGGFGPLGASPDPFAGLGDLGALGMNDPLGGSALGSMPAAANPFGGYAAAPAAGGMNPYASPSAYGSSSSVSGSEHAGKPKRSGLPWDTEGDSALFNTVKMVLFSPKVAFYKMHRTGGIGRPMLFCVAGTVIGALIGTAYNLVFQLIMLLVGGLGENAGVAAVGFMVGGMLGLGFSVVLAAIGAVILSFIYSGIYHLFLLMFGGARQGFETTYRVYCYSAGASALCSVIPCLGGLVGLVMHVITLIIGLWVGHETSLGRSVGAVLLPFVLCIAAGIAIAIFIVTVVMGGMAPAPE